MVTLIAPTMKLLTMHHSFSIDRPPSHCRTSLTNEAVVVRIMNISGHISAGPILKQISLGLCPWLLCCPALTVCSEGTWPLSLVAQGKTTKSLYTPRSDFLLLLDGCPFLMFEACSGRAPEHDRSQMLLQAAVLVRAMNSFRPDEGEYKPFIAVAIYINSKFTAEHYLVGQPQQSSTDVRHQCLIVDTLAQIYYFCRSHISRTNSTSRLQVVHSSSFLNSITSPTPYLLFPSSLVPPPNQKVMKIRSLQEIVSPREIRRLWELGRLWEMRRSTNHIPCPHDDSRLPPVCAYMF